MNVTVKGRGVEITPAMRDFAEKKINKLTDFNSDLRSAEVTCKSEHNNFKIEVMLVARPVGAAKPCLRHAQHPQPLARHRIGRSRDRLLTSIIQDAM